MKVLSHKEVNRLSLFEELLSDNSNGGFIVDSEHLNGILNGLGRTPRFSLLKERIISEYIGFALNDNSFMLHSINKLVVRFGESGLSNYIADRNHFVKKYSDDFGPKVLSLEHLGAGFCVWLACIAVAFIAFIMEICFKKISTVFFDYCYYNFSSL